MVYDLGSDPQRAYSLFNDRMDMGWEFGLIMQAVADCEKSVAEYPNIKPGAEFAGYRKKAAANGKKTAANGKKAAASRKKMAAASR